MDTKNLSSEQIKEYLANFLTQMQTRFPQLQIDYKTYLTANEMIQLVKYPFPAKFRLYNQARDLYSSMVRLAEHLPKSIRNSYGTTMINKGSALCKKIDEVNNMRDNFKRTKGWVACIHLVNSCTLDILTAKENGYFEENDNRKFKRMLKISYELICFLLKLINVDNFKAIVNDRSLTPEHQAEVMYLYAEALNVHNEVKVNTQSNINPANYPPPQQIDPDPGNITGRNLVNFMETMGIPVPEEAYTRRALPIPDTNDLITSKLSKYERQVLDVLNKNIVVFNRDSNINRIQVADSSTNLMKIDLKTEKSMQHKYNLAYGSESSDANKTSIVSVDYFHKGRIEKFRGDINKARSAFQTRILGMEAEEPEQTPKK